MSTRQERWFGIALIVLGIVALILWNTVDRTLGGGVFLLVCAGVVFLVDY